MTVLQMNDMREGTTQKWQHLLRLLEGMDSVAVAFSGGVDSAVLATAAYIVLGTRIAAFTIESPINHEDDVNTAQSVARQIGFSHYVVPYDDLQHTEFSSNPPERCYHCKLARFRALAIYAQQLNLRYLLEGSNVDDEQDYRPGKRAVIELGGRSPLAEVGLTKVEIREIARALGLKVWNRPSEPCLATRIPFYTPITTVLLEQVRQGENYLYSLGFKQVRLRLHNDLARIEVSPDMFPNLMASRDAIISYLRTLGISYVTLDMEGYRQGSMNRVI